MKKALRPLCATIGRTTGFAAARPLNPLVAGAIPIH